MSDKELESEANTSEMDTAQENNEGASEAVDDKEGPRGINLAKVIKMLQNKVDNDLKAAEANLAIIEKGEKIPGLSYYEVTTQIRDLKKESARLSILDKNESEQKSLRAKQIRDNLGDYSRELERFYYANGLGEPEKKRAEHVQEKAEKEIKELRRIKEQRPDLRRRPRSECPAPRGDIEGAPQEAEKTLALKDLYEKLNKLEDEYDEKLDDIAFNRGRNSVYYPVNEIEGVEREINKVLARPTEFLTQKEADEIRLGQLRKYMKQDGVSLKNQEDYINDPDSDIDDRNSLAEVRRKIAAHQAEMAEILRRHPEWEQK